MHRALNSILIVLTWRQLDTHAVKRSVRIWLVWLFRRLLAYSARPLSIGDGPVIVFAPHQDDETLGCGGVIARKRNDGWPVHVVFLTDGSASHPDHPRLSPDELRVIRNQEARDSLKILGVESCAIHFLDATDGTLDHLAPAQREAMSRQIEELVEAVKPTKIYLPCRRDGSTEHDAAFGLVCSVILRTQNRPVVWQYPVWSWWNPLLLLEHTLYSGGHYRLPTEDYHLLKMRAIACYRSQTQPLPPWTDPAIPPELLQVFYEQNEFFFRYDLERDGASPASRFNHTAV